MRERYQWRHTIPLGDRKTDGEISLEAQKEKRTVMPSDLSGQTVLDVGACDGYYSLIAEQRGAEKVIAIDIHQSLADRFSFVKKEVDSDVEYVLADIHSIDFKQSFDVTLFFGILYHHQEPEDLLDKIVDITDHTLCLETACKPSLLNSESLYHSDRPDQSILFEKVNEIKDLCDVCWPTQKWVDERLRERGFTITRRNLHIGSTLRQKVPFIDRLPAPNRLVPTRYALRAERR